MISFNRQLDIQNYGALLFQQSLQERITNTRVLLTIVRYLGDVSIYLSGGLSTGV